MEAHTARWHEVSPGMYIQAKDGSVWKVVEERPGKVLLQSRAGETAIVDRGEPFAEVTVLRLTLEEAEALVAERMAATLEARIEGKTHTCPLAKSRGELATHLLLYHGFVVHQRQDGKALREVHQEAHADADQGADMHGYIHHTHSATIRPLGVPA